MSMANVIRSAAIVERRLRAGEKLRTGYMFNGKAWFDGGDMVVSRVMRNLKRAGKIEQDRDGFVKLASSSTCLPPK